MCTDILPEYLSVKQRPAGDRGGPWISWDRSALWWRVALWAVGIEASLGSLEEKKVLTTAELCLQPSAPTLSQPPLLIPCLGT